MSRGSAHCLAHVSYHYTSMAASHSQTSCFNRFQTFIPALNWTVREKNWDQEVRHERNNKRKGSTNEEQNNETPGFAHSRSALQRLYARVCVLLCACACMCACSWAMCVYVSCELPGGLFDRAGWPNATLVGGATAALRQRHGGATAAAAAAPQQRRHSGATAV